MVDGWDPYEAEPKTDGSANTITLTSDTYTSLLPELDREVAEKAALLVPRGRKAEASEKGL